MKPKEGHTVSYVYLCSVNLCLFSYNVISLVGHYKYRNLSKLAQSSLFSTFSTRRFEKAWTRDCKNEGVWQELKKKTVGRPPGLSWMCNSVLIFSALVLKMRWSHLNSRVVLTWQHRC